MRKSPAALAVLAMAAVVPAAGASAKAQACGASGQAVLVSVGGFKERTGTVRVVVFAGEDNYKSGRPRAARVEVPVTAGSGPMRVCVPLPGARDYAVTVRHDINGNGESDRSDGGGFSGNPRITLGQVISRRNPDYGRTRVDVPAGGVVNVPITLNYLRGLSIGPVRADR